MNPKTVVATLFAALIVTAGAAGAIAAAPGNGNAPDDAGSQGDEHTADGAANGDEPTADDPKNASDGANDAAADAQGERGPPVDMPAHVPDHVVAIHETIRNHIASDFDMLGEAISGIVADGGASADEHAETENDENADGRDDEAATETPTPTPTPIDG